MNAQDRTATMSVPQPTEAPSLLESKVVAMNPANLTACDRDSDRLVFSPSWSSFLRRGTKRIMDVMGSVFLLVLLSPLLLVIAILVKL
jgi:lipopolysaccharide/colanic/teichoic acid biosynthesis glycosyltransferase